MEGGVKTYKDWDRQSGSLSIFLWEVLEWGTSKMPAQPFIEPGFNSSKKQQFVL
ncbi:HK97-gp10 family putative phage morphogenesis protein [Bacillus pacificus]